MSPQGGRSTLITSAPRSQRTMEANGPESTQVRSRMVMPSSGRVMESPGLRVYWEDANRQGRRERQDRLWKCLPRGGATLVTRLSSFVPASVYNRAHHTLERVRSLSSELALAKRRLELPHGLP